MSGFIYIVECIGVDGKVKWTERVHNIIPSAGWDYFLSAALAGGSRYTSWYIGLYQNAYAPVSTETMATLAANGSENIDYTETTREIFTADAISGGLFTNYDNPAEFNFTSSETLRGGFICSDSTKGGTSGLLLSAAQFSSPKSVVSGEALVVKAGIQLISV